MLRRTRDALVDAARPFVDALRPLGRVGANAMWAEVADEVGLATTHAPALDVTEEMVTRVIRFLELPGAPWRRRPDLRSAAVTDTRACLARKAGCCLAYLAAGDHVEVDLDDPELSARQRDWYQRFPPAAEVQQTCTTCSLRELSDCEDRQRFWFELDRDHRT